MRGLRSLWPPTSDVRHVRDTVDLTANQPPATTNPFTLWEGLAPAGFRLVQLSIVGLTLTNLNGTGPGVHLTLLPPTGNLPAFDTSFNGANANYLAILNVQPGAVRSQPTNSSSMQLSVEPGFYTRAKVWVTPLYAGLVISAGTLYADWVKA